MINNISVVELYFFHLSDNTKFYWFICLSFLVLYRCSDITCKRLPKHKIRKNLSTQFEPIKRYIFVVVDIINCPDCESFICTEIWNEYTWLYGSFITEFSICNEYFTT